MLDIVYSETPDFVYDTDFGYFSAYDNTGFSLTPGATYMVIWDDRVNPYTVTAYEASIPGAGNFVVIGDGSSMGYPGNGEPFAIAMNADRVMLFAFGDPSGSHLIVILNADSSPEGTVVFPEQGLELEEVDSVYTVQLGSLAFEITAEEPYIVRWDGRNYECIGKLFEETEDMRVCLLGNLSAVGGEDTGEPFLIVSLLPTQGGEPENSLITTEDDPFHYLGIWRVDRGILLKDHTGTPVKYEMPQRIRMDTTDGGTTEYVHESLVAEPVAKTVELDFSGGDMQVTPASGKVFSGVSIPVPENLIPGNIAEGVDIAGIIGTLVASGGGGEIKIATGTITATSAAITITHNLGMVPDIMIVSATASVSGSFVIVASYGFSKAMMDLAGGELKGSVSATSMNANTTHPIEEPDSDGYGTLSSATETTVRSGSDDMFVHQTSKTYNWVAIGGLT